LHCPCRRHKEIHPPPVAPSRTPSCNATPAPLHFRHLRSSPHCWTPSRCSDCSVATCKPRFPGLGLGSASRLTQPVRRRPSPFGPSCISSRHLDRIGSLVHLAQLAFIDILGASSRAIGVCSSTKLDCIQDIGIFTFTALPPWSRPCGLTSDRDLRSDRTASASLTTALRGFTHLSSGALPSWW
jgi:hypothetical protein